MSTYKYIELGKIVSLIQNGEDHLFSDLYNLSYKHVYFLALNLLKNQQLAEDACQDIFLIIFKNISSLKDPNLYLGWIKKITYNYCIKLIKKENKLIKINSETILNFQINKDTDCNPILRLISNEDYNILYSYINKLPDLYSTVLVMRYFENLKVSEIAHILNIPEGTVKSRLNNAKKRLRKLYDTENGKYSYFGFFICSYFNKYKRTLSSNINTYPNKLFYNICNKTSYLYSFILPISIATSFALNSFNNSDIKFNKHKINIDSSKDEGVYNLNDISSNTVKIPVYGQIGRAIDSDTQSNSKNNIKMISATVPINVVFQIIPNENESKEEFISGVYKLSNNSINNNVDISIESFDKISKHQKFYQNSLMKNDEKIEMNLKLSTKKVNYKIYDGFNKSTNLGTINKKSIGLDNTMSLQFKTWKDFKFFQYENQVDHTYPDKFNLVLKLKLSEKL